MNNKGKAADAYKEAWNILAADESMSESDSGFFAEPRILNFPQRIYLIANTPGTPIDGYQRDLEEFSLDLEFEVSIGADGRPLIVEIIDAKASAATRRHLRRYVRDGGWQSGADRQLPLQGAGHDHPPDELILSWHSRSASQGQQRPGTHLAGWRDPRRLPCLSGQLSEWAEPPPPGMKYRSSRH